ncbi:Acetyl esterase [Streptomyces canus]
MTHVPPPFDPELSAALDLIKDVISPGLTMDEIDVVRQGPGIEMLADLDLTLGGFFEVEDRSVPGPAGAPEISLLICRPTGPASAGTGRPVIYHVHGGGMILGNNRVGVDGPLAWAKELDAVVVSVEYRLAPEHPHPAPVEDVYAGLVWTSEHAAELGGDPERIVIAGASAGGGLSAALALLTRDRKGPRPLGQLLLCPMLDDRNDSPSTYQMAGLGVWDRTANETGWTALLGDLRGGPDVPAYAAPARAEDLFGTAAGLPRRGVGGDVPGRGRRVRLADLAGGRRGGAACVAGRLPRVRRVRSAGGVVPGGAGGTCGVAAEVAGQLGVARAEARKEAPRAGIGRLRLSRGWSHPRAEPRMSPPVAEPRISSRGGATMAPVAEPPRPPVAEPPCPRGGSHPCHSPAPHGGASRSPWRTMGL